MIKNFNFFLLVIIFYLFSHSYSQANFQEKLISKYKKIDTLQFSFTQTIGEKVELGSCYIKYPLMMKCDYPKKKKTIIANGKKFAIIKKRYKKIYYYPLKKTPLFFLLKKENILNLIESREPRLIKSDIIEYELVDEKSNSLKVFFNKNTLELLGWKTIDAYSNEVSFLIGNVVTNIKIENQVFKIPNAGDL
ncbi:outer-membrane lipoprotein carrier protein LolA [Pelagibacteraceae bacterium]|nr:outer-membrane lipoprotein carrier protein LolA [Pelagibacteraceae bacterium]